ncbi:MAG: SusC/RagA family TonB-linked outer membrane protein [Petrimonas sp.]|jgi:TonB-linked SusC/RagA family outer membrane protein
MKGKKMLAYLRGILILLIWIVSLSVFSQNINISGRVVDTNNEPVIGVTIVVKENATHGTVTDNDGNYLLTNVPSNATLQLRYVGMKTTEVAVTGRTTINVVLESDTELLDEVVVIAYGTQKKTELTGSISSVRSDDLEKTPIGQLGQRLQGKLAGVRIYQIEGIPGQGMSFRIRGQASINAGNSPLVVIDGFPSSTGLDAISPDEIENISVLKDASASSLYGSRAANGVILVTTKQAKKGRTDIRLSLYGGIQKIPQRGRPDVMNARQFAQYKNEWYSDQGMEVPERYKNPEQYGPNDGTDWFEILLNPKATIQNYNLSFSSGTDKVKSAINLSYNETKGVLLNTMAERITARANNIFNISDRFTFGLNLASTYRKSDNQSFAPAYWSFLSSAYIMDPTLEYKNPDGTLPVGFSSPGMFPNPNWYRVLTERENPTSTINILANVFGEYKIVAGLLYKLKADVDLGNSKNRYWSPSTAQGAMFQSPPNPPTGSYSSSNSLNWQLENTLNYTKSFDEVHNIDILLGFSAQRIRSESSWINGSRFPDDEIPWINVATNRIGNVSVSEFSLVAALGRLNYNYKGKYLTSFAIRRDGSSRFGDNKKYGVFPSVSTGWIVSEENFMKEYKNTVSFLKLRASSGKVGNYNIGNYSHISSVGNANYVFNNSVVSGKAISNLGNSSLTWETTVQNDIGFDLGLFNDRIFFVYDYYWKKTNGLLYAVDIPRASGFSSIQSNIGEFDFWGHEFSLETRNFVNEFKWNTQLTFGLDRNMVKKLGTENTPIGGYQENSDFNRTEVGHPIGLFYGYVYEGVFMNEAELAKGPHITVYGGSDVGSVRLKDISGPNGVPDGLIHPEYDKTFIGDPNPKFIYGITNNLSYKNFDLNIHLIGRVGGDVFKGDLLSIENIDGVFNVRPAALDRWRSVDNPGKGDLPRCNSNPLHRFNNSRHIFDGSYLAGKSIVLGYTIPLKSKDVIKSARVYISSQNAFMITKYPGPNPEASQNGLNGLSEGRDFAPYPIPRTFTIGVDINL